VPDVSPAELAHALQILARSYEHYCLKATGPEVGRLCLELPAETMGVGSLPYPTEKELSEDEVRDAEVVAASTVAEILEYLEQLGIDPEAFSRLVQEELRDDDSRWRVWIRKIRG
jgi:hypothetical protein